MTNQFWKKKLYPSLTLATEIYHIGNKNIVKLFKMEGIRKLGIRKNRGEYVYEFGWKVLT